MNELIRLEHISKRYGEKAALRDVSISFAKGEGQLIVGQTGSGKTTMAQVICGGVAPDSGALLFEGEPLAPSCRDRDFRSLAAIQYIFQDPYSATDPRWTVAQTLEEAVRICKRHRHPFLPPKEALAAVDPSLLPYYGQKAGILSGGQLQKVCVARALIPRPQVLIADEATSMLDQAGARELFRLLHSIRQERGIAVIAVVHDIDFSEDGWDRIAVFQQGEILEQLPFRDFIPFAAHPYSKKLIESYRYFNR